MAKESPEKQGGGGRKTYRERRAAMETYALFGVLLIVVLLVGAWVLSNKSVAKDGLDKVGFLPGWVIPIIVGLVGFGIWKLGTSMIAQWPEVLGAALLAIAVGTGEIMIGWNKFALGGLWIMPALIPLGVFMIFVLMGFIKTK